MNGLLGVFRCGCYSCILATPPATTDRLGKLSSEICVSDIGGFVGFHVSCNMMIVYPLSLTYSTLGHLMWSISDLKRKLDVFFREAVCRSIMA